LELDPENYVALNNLALALNTQRKFAQAESLTLRGIAVAPTQATLYINAAQAQIGQGNYAAAARIAELFAQRAPGNPMRFILRARSPGTRHHAAPGVRGPARPPAGVDAPHRPAVRRPRVVLRRGRTGRAGAAAARRVRRPGPRGISAARAVPACRRGRRRAGGG